jgi:hypothetical protein
MTMSLSNILPTFFARDARAILERNIKLNAEGVLDGQEKIYRGQGGYKNYITKDIASLGSNKYTGTQGPLRATTTMRATAVFDYKVFTYPTLSPSFTPPLNFDSLIFVKITKKLDSVVLEVI